MMRESIGYLPPEFGPDLRRILGSAVRIALGSGDGMWLLDRLLERVYARGYADGYSRALLAERDDRAADGDRDTAVIAVIRALTHNRKDASPPLAVEVDAEQLARPARLAVDRLSGGGVRYTIHDTEAAEANRDA
jgi:hypothetical protein